MCDAIFTFGQFGNHFFQCPSKRDYARLPKKLQRLLTSNQIWQIYHVTLGFENSFLITWRDRSGGDHIDSQDLPPELDTFLYARNTANQYLRIIPQVRLTLGAYNSSFFAHDHSAYQWMNLPPNLLNALQSRIEGNGWRDKPRIVALGCDDNFLLITASHAAVWNLSNYRTASSMLQFAQSQASGIQEIHNIILHSYRYQCFIAHSSNGSLIFENLPPHELEGMQAMMEPLVKDTREAEQRKRMVGQREDGRKRMVGQKEDGRKSSLGQRQEMLRRDWGERNHQFKMEARGLRLSLKMGISAGGISKMLGHG